MSETQRLLIVHNHLFKNAGTTIDWILTREFGAGFVDHRDDVQMRRGAEYLVPYLAENPEIRALSTHHLRLPLPDIDGISFALIQMFRHPVERVSSVYEFERRQKNSQTLGAIKARESSCQEYVAWRLEPGRGATIRNFHVLKSLPVRRGKPDLPDDTDLQQAIAFVRDLPMMGLVERFDESMVLFEACLRPYFPEIDFSYLPQNVGQPIDAPRAQRIERLRSTLGEELYARFLEVNAPDLGLYAFAEEEFARRLHGIDDLAGRLAEFRRRCERRLRR